MTAKYGKFEMPHRINIDEESLTSTFARFIIEPFERGFGHTLGNPMRRTMLSSLEAPAIISVRIEGVLHEFMAIEGIVEDMVNIILNLKGALLRKIPDEQPLSREPRILTTVIEITQEDLDQNQGKVKIKLGDLIKSGIFEVVNPDLHVFTATLPMRRQVDLRVAIGRGYVPSERLHIREKATDEILIDASFSPVKMANYFVENTRVGQDTEFDRLILEVLTDGRITPVEAISFASQISLKHFEVFNKVRSHHLVYDEGEQGEDLSSNELMQKLCLRIDEIELSVRSANCLSGANIDTIGELVSIPEKKMLLFRNFGKKSLNEIKDKLEKMGLHLGMDLSAYGINFDNVKEKINEYNKLRKAKKVEKVVEKPVDEDLEEDEE